MASNQTSVWRGSKALEQGKLQWDFSAEEEALTVPFFGPYGECLAQKPKPGQQLQGFTNTNLRVAKVRVEEGDGETGTLTVTLSAPKIADDDVTFEQLGEPIFEINFSEGQRPIELHPRCGTLKPDRPENDKLKRILTWEDWAYLKDADYDASTSPFATAAKWSLATYKRLRERGIEGYHFSFPEVRRTSYYFRDPGGVGQGCGVVQSPPVGSPTHSGGHTLQYLLVSDSLVKEGRLRKRETAWLGAHDIDTDVYP